MMVTRKKVPLMARLGLLHTATTRKERILSEEAVLKEEESGHIRLYEPREFLKLEGYHGFNSSDQDDDAEKNRTSLSRFDSYKVDCGKSGEVEVWATDLDPQKETVFFYHSMGQTVNSTIPEIGMLEQAGYNVVVFDYPGYGHSTGKPNKNTIYDAAAKVVNFVKAEYKIQNNGKVLTNDKLLFWGESLGTPVAIKMATLFKDCKSVVLAAPFTSTSDVAIDHLPPLLGIGSCVVNSATWFTQQDFNVKKLVKDIASPVIITHSKEDPLVPIDHSRKISDIRQSHNDELQTILLELEGSRSEGEIRNTGSHSLLHHRTLELVQSYDRDLALKKHGHKISYSYSDSVKPLMPIYNIDKIDSSVSQGIVEKVTPNEQVVYSVISQLLNLAIEYKVGPNDSLLDNSSSLYNQAAKKLMGELFKVIDADKEIADFVQLVEHVDSIFSESLQGSDCVTRDVSNLTEVATQLGKILVQKEINCIEVSRQSIDRNGKLILHPSLIKELLEGLKTLGLVKVSGEESEICESKLMAVSL